MLTPSLWFDHATTSPKQSAFECTSQGRKACNSLGHRNHLHIFRNPYCSLHRRLDRDGILARHLSNHHFKAFQVQISLFPNILRLTVLILWFEDLQSFSVLYKSC